jgi:hypothetical protein
MTILFVYLHHAKDLIGIPTKTEKMGSGRIDICSVEKTWTVPPKSATASMLPSPLKVMPQLVIENKD